jgi:RND family efflux transporter MFP subunit
VTQKQPLIEIADLSRLMVKTAVSEDVVSKLRRGQRVKVTLYSDTEKSISGVISMVTPGVNFQTRTAGVEIAIPRGGDIKPGMTCAVEFVKAERSGAITVPLEAVLTDIQGNKKVFLVKEGKAVAAPIVTGIEDNTRAEVLTGVNAGDDIVVLGQDNLKHGVKVKIAKPVEKKEGKKEDKGVREPMP